MSDIDARVPEQSDPVARQRFRGALVDVIDAYRAGRITAIEMLNRTWAMYTAVDFLGRADRDEFVAVYYDATIEDDKRQPIMPAGLGSDEAFEEAVDRFRDWASSD
jgi:hypothetical protein